MTSAFEHYSKKKKIRLNDGLPKIQEKYWKSSTPLPQNSTHFFSIVSPDKISPVNNIFLSPVLEGSKRKKKTKDQPKEVPIEINQEAIIDGKLNKIKEKKLKTKISIEKKGRNSKNNEESLLVMENGNGSAPIKEENCGKKRKNKNKINKIVEKDADSDNLPDVFKDASENLKRKRKNDGNQRVKKRKIDSECMSSLDKGKQMLEWILSPIAVNDFFSNYWEKRPLHIARENINYFDGLCSKEDLDNAFRNSQINLQKNVTVTAYDGEKRLTDKTPGRARPNTMWDLFENGQSIRLVNPQSFIPSVGTLVATLQEYFRCMVGVNSYLTPAGTQGFAPHYDDIEAFVLQVEGEKDWLVYPPRNIGETLPQVSSRDFDQQEIGEPMLEVTLKPGDLLYFPRGFIHQARSVEDHHSLHLTVSTYQFNTWGDFFKKTLPMALERAIVEDVDFREGLPIDFIDHMGLISEDSNKAARQSYIEKSQNLFGKLVNYCSWDDAADELGKDFIHSSYPPPHDEIERETWKKLFKKSSSKLSMRLIAANVCRLTNEEGGLVIYYSTDNSLTPREDELLGFSVSSKEAAVFQSLVETYPKYTNIAHLSENDGHSRKAVKSILVSLAQRALIKVKEDSKNND